MKNAPPESPLVAGPELASESGDEASVQHAMHEPQPRVHVQQESRTIVVADDSQAGAADRETRKLEPYTASRGEQTVVIRARRGFTGLGAGKKRSLAAVLLWVAAGLAAFGLGGALAVMTAKPEQPAQAEPAVAHQPVTKPTATAPRPTPAASAKPVAVAESVEGPAVNAAELPIEKDEPEAPAPATTRKPASTRPPGASSAAASPSKLPVAPQAKSDIPSGI